MRCFARCIRLGCDRYSDAKIQFIQVISAFFLGIRPHAVAVTTHFHASGELVHGNRNGSAEDADRSPLEREGQPLLIACPSGLTSLIYYGIRRCNGKAWTATDGASVVPASAAYAMVMLQYNFVNARRD